MTDRSDTPSEAAQAPGMIFIKGDQASGLIISDSGETTLTFDCRGVPVRAVLERTEIRAGVFADSLTLAMAEPVRFSLKWLIPENALNAAMTMNQGLLISPFSNRFPEGGLPVPSPACGHDSPISTLRPGQFQSIEFNWYPGDQLVLYLVLPSA